ncbi:hypothetical protein HPP92_023704 [Vanilla planifolia]|uniref:Tubby-like F-box protein n=1 Tax=Vanilla planifolia TaxID=51239 RepID=A0A835PL28_VANPL|nr:hypothetical protein HPP92_023704 [Vanilla planifolia]
MSRRPSFLRSFSGASFDLFGETRRRLRDAVDVASAELGEGAASEGDERWSRMLPELMVDIIERVETSEEQWPVRKNVVSCACVCRKWREITIGVVGSTQQTGKITFPSSLKQPGPSDMSIHCFIRRNKKNSTFYLYLNLTQAVIDQGKFLLAARRFRRGYHTEYVISLDADDFSQGSNAYMGKLRSDFLGTRFTIYDCNPPYEGATAASGRSSRRFASKRISPQVPAGNYEIGQVGYKFNLFRSRQPRRMQCELQPPAAAKCVQTTVVVKNKAPRWHEHLQCWCLNFHGRVTVASVKNFQLVAASDQSAAEAVLLQFGKVGEDVFTMDYTEPLSAFQAFAIGLTSFGTKLACE